jgi:hypothetical protein
LVIPVSVGNDADELRRSSRIISVFFSAIITVSANPGTRLPRSVLALLPQSVDIGSVDGKHVWLPQLPIMEIAAGSRA